MVKKITYKITYKNKMFICNILQKSVDFVKKKLFTIAK